MPQENPNPLFSALRTLGKSARPTDAFVAKCIEDLYSGNYWGEEISGQGGINKAVAGRGLILAQFIGSQPPYETIQGGYLLWTKKAELVEPAIAELSKALEKYHRAPSLRISPGTDQGILSILKEKGLYALGSLQVYMNSETARAAVCLAYPKPLADLGYRTLKDSGWDMSEINPRIGSQVLTVSYLSQFRNRFGSPIPIGA